MDLDKLFRNLARPSRTMLRSNRRRRQRPGGEGAGLVATVNRLLRRR